jgi:hypothetical protein
MKHIRRLDISGNSIASGTRDRTAVDLTQIDLILRIELDRVRERALDQIERVLREFYPDNAR